MSLPSLTLVRHGETAWTASRQHTGRTDIPLSLAGERHAATLASRLRGKTFAAVFTSPLQRAMKTCALAGFGDVAHQEHDLVEWDYGSFEGKTTTDIQALHPGWQLFRDGCPDGETLAEVAVRADRFISKVRSIAGVCLAFSSGHFSRVLTARWLGLPPDAGRCFLCDTASVGILGYEHSLEEPVIRLWNETGER